LATLLSPVTSERVQSMQQAYRAYLGASSVPFRSQRAGVDDNLIISLARVVVDKGVSFLFGRPVVSQVTSAEPEPKQIWLDECWRRNKRAPTLQKLATNGGICGHAFVRLVENDPYPRVVILDPQTVDVTTNPDDIEDIWAYAITPPLNAPLANGEASVQHRTLMQTPSGAAGYLVDGPLEWIVHDQELHGGAWVDTVTTPWPYEFPPVLGCQNLPRANDFWGESDLPGDVRHVMDAITRVASNYNRIIRLYAHPKLWTRGMGSRSIDASIDAVIHLPSDTAELHALEMQSDLGSTMALLEKLLDILAMMVRIPLVALGQPDQMGALSGVALQIRYQPLLEKTESKRTGYGDLLIEIDRCLFAMGGFGDAIGTALHWPEVMPADPMSERQALILDESLGVVSKQTIAARLGYDYDKEQAQIIVEHDEAVAAGLALPPDEQGLGALPPAPLLGPLPNVAKSVPVTP